MKFVPVILLLLAAINAGAAVKLPVMFGDHAVLQNGRPVPVWGWAKPDSQVTVAFAGQMRETSAGADGKWHVTLSPLAVSKEPRELVVSDPDGKVVVKDILVGEVWLLGGQSNMEWTLNNSENGPETAAQAANPLLRLITIGHQTGYAPCADARGEWSMCTPESAAKFSAIGYFFGQKLVRGLDIPVGLISDNWGGSAIEPWINLTGFRSEPELKAVADAIEAKIPGSEVNRSLTAKTLADYQQWVKLFEQQTADGKLPPPPPVYPEALKVVANDPKIPSVIFNGKIAPVAPYALRGVLWYQGESNNQDGTRYTAKLRALYFGWKTAFANDKLEFYVVQLAPYNFGNNFNLPNMWLAQTQFVKNEPNAALAVINDIGDFGNIHPAKKEPVGYRLALLALRRCYGKEITAYSPEPESLTRNGNRLVLQLKNAQALKLTGGRSENFEIAGKDGVFYPAAAEVSGTQITLSSANVSEPYLARYGWKNCFTGDVFNEAGLPLGTFEAGQLPEQGIYSNVVPEIKKYQLLYQYNLKSGANKRGYVDYLVDRSRELSGPIRRVGYFIQLEQPDGKWQYVWAAIKPLTQDYAKLGVPAANTQIRFEGFVDELEVLSNVPGVENGKFEHGNIEFWSQAYSGANLREIPGADPQRYDFGDTRLDTGDFGSMQLHNFQKKQTVFAYNNFNAGREADIGIGNNPDRAGQPDWTFTKSAQNYKQALLYVFVEPETQTK